MSEQIESGLVPVEDNSDANPSNGAENFFDFLKANMAMVQLRKESRIAEGVNMLTPSQLYTMLADTQSSVSFGSHLFGTAVDGKGCAKIVGNFGGVDIHASIVPNSLSVQQDQNGNYTIFHFDIEFDDKAAYPHNYHMMITSPEDAEEKMNGCYISANYGKRGETYMTSGEYARNQTK